MIALCEVLSDSSVLCAFTAYEAALPSVLLRILYGASSPPILPSPAWLRHPAHAPLCRRSNGPLRGLEAAVAIPPGTALCDANGVVGDLSGEE